MVRIAIQKSGRLNKSSLELLKSCGISIDNGKDQLKAAAKNFPMEVFYYEMVIFPNTCVME